MIVLGSAAIVVMAAVMFASTLRNRKRPILSITDSALEFAPLRAWRLRRVEGASVVGIEPDTPYDIVVKTSGRRRELAIPLRELPKPAREEARAAVTSWAARHAPSPRVEPMDEDYFEPPTENEK